ncbi:MAG: hypothetical protein IPM18_00985 [Phycisphaerales bacterium]|nr:hypothetical protein [Phycisphaerales bacterium]
MIEFIGLLKLVVGCSSLLFLATLVLLALPQSRLRATGLEMVKWALVAGLVLLIFSPLDLLPGLPIDDVFYLIGVILAGKSAFSSRDTRLLYTQAEQAELRSRVDGGRS